MMQTKPVEVLTPRVLVVDDDAETLAALGRVFRGEAVQLVQTRDPWVALERIKSKDIHLLITDEYMPGLRGTDLLEAVGVHSPGTATILLTGYPKPAAAYRSAKHRMDLMMRKPWDDQALLDGAFMLLREHSPRAVFRPEAPAS